MPLRFEALMVMLALVILPWVITRGLRRIGFRSVRWLGPRLLLGAALLFGGASLIAAAGLATPPLTQQTAAERYMAAAHFYALSNFMIFFAVMAALLAGAVKLGGPRIARMAHIQAWLYLIGVTAARVSHWFFLSPALRGRTNGDALEVFVAHGALFSTMITFGKLSIAASLLLLAGLYIATALGHFRRSSTAEPPHAL